LNNVLPWCWQWQRKKKMLGMLLGTCAGKLQCLCALFSSAVFVSRGRVGQDVIRLPACSPEIAFSFQGWVCC